MSAGIFSLFSPHDWERSWRMSTRHLHILHVTASTMTARASGAGTLSTASGAQHTSTGIGAQAHQHGIRQQAHSTASGSRHSSHTGSRQQTRDTGSHDRVYPLTESSCEGGLSTCSFSLLCMVFLSLFRSTGCRTWSLPSTL